MRKWTMSACVVLAWCILPLAALAGLRASGPSQASGSTAVSVSTGTSISTVSSISSARTTMPVVLASQSTTQKPAKPTATPAQRHAAWTVRPGDSLSAIAASLGIRGGWQALYAANRHAIGPNPNLIGVGTVLALPGAPGSTRYTVGPGDSLSAIAASLGIPGGWQALYAANRHAIGPNPDVIRPGIILGTPHQETHGQAARPSAPTQASPGRPTTPATASPSTAPTKPTKATTPATRTSHLSAPSPSAGGMPRWLVDVLIAAGVLAATAFAAEPAAALARRRKAAGKAPVNDGPSASRPRHAAWPAPPAWSIPRPRSARHRQTGSARDTRRLAKKAADKARIILADHERLIVTYSVRDHTVYVLTPPGEDPMAVLAAARLVVPEDTYNDLAGLLGVRPTWPPD